ncbi:hypothetical protein DSM106972_035120 [Dulcicalothrix desertica PCC 7102]|uniref:Uncharacterized protein n=1 Tax=Dulcicalothrix desertica PCC 7102 TaxID=232991 RepID=A0A433VHG5_9CYAN|nr:hypothetical protein [Dulcicalothrix desertica]RUT05505.1 hypothetical protein DSM106972_035120 [Dulcicalothrix desertica PCC 7102]TWH54604.1 hypothetical protein CAL7102_02651 [Dulcicalothrix desertica PCC 7102]
MFEPLQPQEFCAKWVPRKSNKKVGRYGYRKECCKLLAELTGYNESSCSNWLTDPSDIPKLAPGYLRLLDIVWEMQIIIPAKDNNSKES